MSSDARAPVREASASARLARTCCSSNSAPMADDQANCLYGPGAQAKSHDRLRAVSYAGMVVVLVAAGSLSLLPLWQAVGNRWATDPLRSIGAFFPLVACVGVLSAWRRLGWSRNGSFWGLLLVGISILLARPLAVSSFMIGFDWLRIAVVNAGTALFLYGAGAVLLFGGPRLLRASIAPLCLLLLINPVPGAFNSVVDMPLQHLSASTARSFAHLIGLQPTGVQLRMMFTPDFGMFIAPGCNGVRGSITLGYLALIFGYARRLRPRTLASITLAALLLGYALNLLRLCVLVIYYRIGVSLPSIQKYGAGTDYVIGCTLFLLAALGLGLLIRSLEPRPAISIQRPEQRPNLGRSGDPLEARRHEYSAVARALCFLGLTLAFIVPELHSAPPLQIPGPNEQEILGSFPAEVGPYRLTRTWSERGSTGTIVLAMGEYAAPPEIGDTDKRFTLGLWVGSANHLVAESKFIQGIVAQWTGTFDATTRQALPVHFVTSFYDDGISRHFDAESNCSASGCEGTHADVRHEGLFFAAPRVSDLAYVPNGKRLPILLRREWLDEDPTPVSELRKQFEADARLFMAQVDLRPLLAQDGSQF